MSENSSIETVFWINSVPLNRREKIARWWIEDVRQQHTYRSKRQRKQEFTTSIQADTIDQLACKGLKTALLNQKNNREEGAGFITYPRATPDGSRYLGSILIPSKPLGVRFTANGSEELNDE